MGRCDCHLMLSGSEVMEDPMQSDLPGAGGVPRIYTIHQLHVTTVTDAHVYPEA